MSAAQPASSSSSSSSSSDAVSSAAAAAAEAEAQAADVDVTAEGRSARALDPALELRLQHAVRLATPAGGARFGEAADLLSTLTRIVCVQARRARAQPRATARGRLSSLEERGWPAAHACASPFLHRRSLARAHRPPTACASLFPRSCERYGQLAIVCAPVYHAYGDALLKVIEANTDAMGGGGGDGGGGAGAAGGGGAGAADEDEDEEDEEEEAPAAAAAGAGAGADGHAAASSSSSRTAAEAGEEDISQEGADEEAGDDLQLAFECLDLARVLYIRAAAEAPEGAARTELRLTLSSVFKRDRKSTRLNSSHLA